MVRELSALVVLAAAILAVLVGRPGTGASWLTAERIGDPVRFRGIVDGEARIEQAGDDRRRVVVELAARSGARKGRSPVDLVLLVDVSNSMRRAGRLVRARAWVEALVGVLEPGDRMALVSFARRPEVLHRLGEPGDPGETLGRIRPSGPTDLGEGLRLAAALSAGEPGRLRRLVVFAGGPPNHGLRIDQLADRDPPRAVPTLVDLSGSALRQLAVAWGGGYSDGEAPDPAGAEEVLGARHFAVRDLRIRLLGPAASRLVFHEGRGLLIVGGGSLGDLVPGSSRRLVAEFGDSGPALRGPLGLQLDYQVPDGDGWGAADEGGTLSF